MRGSVQVIDRVYGPYTIREQLINDLLLSPSMQRLRGIDQAGYFAVYQPGTEHSRFEHSLGVYILLTMYGAPLLERVAGLLHDVSHSAFSHCIDYVLPEGSPSRQDHQDNMFRDYVLASELPQVVKHHGFDIEEVLDHGKFPLLEQPLPDLCADRIDYSLRAAVVYGVLDERQVSHILSRLLVRDKQWVFTRQEAAEEFAELFVQMNDEYFCGINSALMFARVGAALRYALEQGYITTADLYTTDNRVLELMRSRRDSDNHLALLLDHMDNKLDLPGEPEKQETITCKSRVVDPLHLDEHGAVHRLSQSYPAWKEMLTLHMQPRTFCIHVH